MDANPRMRAMATRSRAAADGARLAAGQHASPNLIDAPTLFAGCGGDPVLHDKMVSLFAVHLPGYIAEIDRAIHDRNQASLQSASHKLCGLSAMFSAGAADLVRTMEGYGAAQDWSGTARIYGDVRDALRVLCERLDRCTIDDLRELAAELPQD